MLVLTQKEGEVLQVGPDIKIYIKRIKGNWVRLCIDAPRDVHLQRIPAHEVEGSVGLVEAPDAGIGIEPARR